MFKKMEAFLLHFFIPECRGKNKKDKGMIPYAMKKEIRWKQIKGANNSN